MKIIRTKADLRKLTRNWRMKGETIGVVPTMGALHPGHLSLVTAALARADLVIVTLFVNPRQFNNSDDLAKYPRTEESDAEKLKPLSVDVLYIPEPEQIYPDGFATNISVSGVSAGLCGESRPGHFDGVATIVTKLLLQTDATFAFFGQKDYQQLKVVQRLATDLDLPVEIVGCPTLRETDGLAMSSRNLRLDDEARKIAPLIHKTLIAAASEIAQGRSVDQALKTARDHLIQAGFSAIDYLDYRRDIDLVPLKTCNAPGRLLLAAWLQGVRLIDNVPVTPASTVTRDLPA